MDDRDSPVVRRRDLLGLPTAALAAAVTVAAPSAAAPHAPEQEAEVTPPEDLMREHGVLKRLLLVYREGIRRIECGERAPAQSLNAAARIIRGFIEDYHEHLEEKYVFPRLRDAGRLTGTVSVLLLQHRRGRELTGRILAATRRTTGARAARTLVADMAAFVRMYEPHEAREDTVVFPAFREVVPAKEFLRLGEVFEDEEHRRFGPRGFEGVVDQVADIEKALGIYDLSRFTPPG
ncbi:hemerythrin domain-containing protein [Microbispora siamensis]